MGLIHVGFFSIIELRIYSSSQAKALGMTVPSPFPKEEYIRSMLSLTQLCLGISPLLVLVPKSHGQRIMSKEAMLRVSLFLCFKEDIYLYCDHSSSYRWVQSLIRLVLLRKKFGRLFVSWLWVQMQFMKSVVYMDGTVYAEEIFKLLLGLSNVNINLDKKKIYISN